MHSIFRKVATFILAESLGVESSSQSSCINDARINSEEQRKAVE
jgi:hypothetical protein